MIKKIFWVIVSFVFLLVTINSALADTLKDSQLTDSGTSGYYSRANERNMSSTFTAGSNYQLGIIEVYLEETGNVNDGQTYLELYATSGYLPTGSPLAKSNNSVLGTALGAAAWYNFTFTGYSISSGVVYAIVYVQDGITTSDANYINVKNNNAANPNKVGVQAPAGTWSVLSNDRQALFKTWTYEPQPYTPPVVNWALEEPENRTYNETTMPAQGIPFSFNITDSAANACYLKIDGSVYEGSQARITSVIVNTNYTLNYTDYFNDEDNRYNFTVMCDDGTSNVTSTGKYINYDLNAPTITKVFPNPTSTSIWVDRTIVPLNMSCDDSNELWSFYFKLYRGEVTYTFYVEDLNDTNYTYDTVTDLDAIFTDGIVYTDIECYDSHTDNEISDYTFYEGGDFLGYNTGQNVITVTSLESDVIATTTKQKDRYDFSFDYNTIPEGDIGRPEEEGEGGLPTTNTYSFILHTAEKLKPKSNTKYKGHFISGKNWIDFELPEDKESTVTYEKVDEYTYIITVTTILTTLDFHSIGGLNLAKDSGHFRLGDTAPSTPTTITPEEGHQNDSQSINLTCADSIDTEGDPLYYSYYADGSVAIVPVCINVPGECIYNYTVTPWDYHDTTFNWTCNASDGMLSSDQIPIREVTVRTVDIYNVNTFYPAVLTKGEDGLFEINLSYNEIRYNASDVNINFINNTYTTTKEVYGNTTRYYKNINFLETGSYEFNWTINLTRIDDHTIYSNSTYTGSLLVNPLEIFINCLTNDTHIQIFNISFWNEMGEEDNMKEIDFRDDDLNKTGIDRVEFTYDMSFYINNEAINTTINNATENITDFSVCIPLNTTYRSIATMEYWAEDYNDYHRYYYFNRRVFTNTSENIPLYLLTDSKGSAITISLKDTDGAAITNSYVYYSKYDGITNTWPVVAMGYITTDPANDVIWLRLKDTPYNIRFEKGTETLYSIMNQKVTDLVQQYAIDPDLFNWKNFNNLGTSIYHYADTFFLEWATQEDMQEITMKVYQQPGNAKVCDESSSSDSGIISCNLTTQGYMTVPGDYWAVATVKLSSLNYTDIIGNDIIKVWDTEKFNLLTRIGTEGVIASYLLVGTMAFMGSVFSPAIGLSLLGLSLVAVVLMGFMYISYSALITLCILLGWVIYKMRR